MRRPPTLMLLLSILIGTMLAACGVPHQYTGTVLNPPKALEDWTLTDQHGQPFQLRTQDDTLTVLYFGYTNCPDYCPTTMGEWKQIKEQLGADADRLRFAMVTVDPERDTEDVLARYLANFDESFIGLRPTPEQVAALSREYGVGVAPPAATTHDHADHPDPVQHGTYTYVLDGTPQLRLLLRDDIPLEAMVADIRALLRSR